MSTITKDLGVVTAYGYAVSKGYTGTEEEFAELMASYATVAEQAAQSAETAEEAAEAAAQAVLDANAAQTAAQTAQTAAESASTTATNAATSASNSATSAASAASTASTAATTATEKAQEAATSATSASESATDANAAKTAAQTAKTDAETAQGKAEEAQAKAEEAAEDLSAEVAQIETNKNDIADLKSDLIELKTETGDQTANLMPFNSHSALINGVSAKYVNGKIMLSGTANDTGGRTKHVVDVPLNAGTYRVSISEAPTKVFVQNSSNQILAELNSGGGAFFTLDSDETVFIGINFIDETAYSSTIEIMVSSGTGVFDYVEPINSANDKIAREKIDNPAENVIPSITDGDGYFINTSGIRFALQSYVYTDIIKITKGQTLKFRANGETPSIIAMLTRWSEDGDFIENLYTCASTQYETVEYTATHEVELLRLCYSKGLFAFCTITGKSMASTIIPSFADYDVFPFNTIGVIGDSLANGASNYENSQGVMTGADRPNYSWGKFLERRYGVDVTLFAKGGASTRSWIDTANSWGITALQNAERQDLYIIGLGANDYYSLGAAYLGNVSQIVTDASQQQSDTYYGNYSKIICLIKQKSPRSKIFCLTNPDMPSMVPPQVCKNYNTAVRNIVDAFDENVYLLDLEKDMYYISSQAKDLWYWGHSTAIGYANIAEHMWKIMNEFIRSNYTEFLDVQWIQENHD